MKRVTTLINPQLMKWVQVIYFYFATKIWTFTSQFSVCQGLVSEKISAVCSKYKHGPTVCATSILVLGSVTVGVTGQITIMGFAPKLWNQVTFSSLSRWKILTLEKRPVNKRQLCINSQLSTVYKSELWYIITPNLS